MKTQLKAGKSRKSAVHLDLKKGTHVELFRLVKRKIFGKSHKKSADLLGQWILKKRPLSLFF